jgi:hypothetical protein
MWGQPPSAVLLAQPGIVSSNKNAIPRPDGIFNSLALTSQ